MTYCAAELQRLERMRPWLTDRGIEVVAMTHAGAREVLAQIERDHLGFPIIIDQDLEVTRRLGWFDRSGSIGRRRKRNWRDPGRM